jgi:hypothetical protein
VHRRLINCKSKTSTPCISSNLHGYKYIYFQMSSASLARACQHVTCGIVPYFSILVQMWLNCDALLAFAWLTPDKCIVLPCYKCTTFLFVLRYLQRSWLKMRALSFKKKTQMVLVPCMKAGWCLQRWRNLWKGHAICSEYGSSFMFSFLTTKLWFQG